jgi:hypothetical protein
MARPDKRGRRMRGKAGRWRGGRIYRSADGKKVYEIRRTVKGRRYEVSTGCTTETAAFAQLERFEKDPENYRPAGDPSTGAGAARAVEEVKGDPARALPAGAGTLDRRAVARCAHDPRRHGLARVRTDAVRSRW